MFFETFWRNPEIGRLSRLFLVFVLALIPGAYLMGRYYVAPESCVADLRKIFGIEVAILVVHSVFFWLVDRPKVLKAFSRLVDSDLVKIRKVGIRYELLMNGGYQGHLSYLSLFSFGIFLLALLVLGSWWDQPLRSICQRRLIGSLPVSVVALGVSFIIVTVSQMLLWACSTIPVWRLRATPP